MAIKLDREQQRANRLALAEAAHRGGLRLPDAVREMRKALGLNQEQFGQILKLTRRQVSELENGEGDPKLSTLNRIGRVFGLSIGFVPKKQSAAKASPKAPAITARR